MERDLILRTLEQHHGNRTHAARTLGIKIPEQLSVIGYDNIRDAEYLNLTTIQQPLYQAGLVGGETLLQLIDQPQSEPKEIFLPVELVVRETTAHPIS